ncbi:MAG: hypothetical protein WD648_00760 [Planctomycetaceae bacterium]
MAKATFPIKLDDEMAATIALFLENSQSLGRVVGAMVEAEPKSSIGELAKDVARACDIPLESVHAIFTTLWNISRGSAILQQNVEQTIAELTTAMVRYGRPPLDDSRLAEWKQVVPELASAVQRITPDSSLMISSKAMALCYERPFTLHKVRILSDIRPVFNEEATRILEMIVTQTLVIDYSTADGIKDIHLTMDIDDVTSLREQCERAELKARTIVTAMEECNWSTAVFSSGSESE